MAILNWRDHPRMRFVDFPPAAVNKGAVFIASDLNDSAWISDGTTYYPIGGQGLAPPNFGEYTWPTKPLANSLPVRSRISIPELGNGEWYTDGTYWRPVSVAKLILDFSGISTTQTTSGVVAGAPTLSLPFYDLMTTPGIIIESCVSNFRSSPQNSQAHSTELRIDRQDGNSQSLASVSATNTSQTTARGTARYLSPTGYQSPSANQAYSGSTNQGGSATNLFNAGVMYPVKLWANTGGAGETMTFTPGLILIY